MQRLALLKERSHCVAFDFRGQGQSEVTRSGYDMETLYEDAVALIEQLGCAPCHFLGLSMGGFLGLRLAAWHPELLRSLILLETSADPEPGKKCRKGPATHVRCPLVRTGPGGRPGDARHVRADISQRPVLRS